MIPPTPHTPTAGQGDSPGAQITLSDTNPLKVFRINENDWYTGRTLDEAIEAAIDETGLPRDELVYDPRELDDAELQRRQFRADDGSTRTFAEQLALDNKHAMKPGMFASKEY